MQTSTKVLLGSGVLSWHTCERITGRYGTISIFPKDLSGEASAKPSDLAIHSLLGQQGQFIAIQDNTEFLLGAGTLFVEDLIAGQRSVGVKSSNPLPDEAWLNIDALYRLDGVFTEKSVELYFVKSEAGNE